MTLKNRGITPGAGGGGTLGPTTASFTAGAASGTLIAAITGLASGETIASVLPDDGRLALDGTRRSLLVGLTAASAGTIAAFLTTSTGRTLAMSIAVSAGGGLPVPTALLMSNRLNLLGTNGSSDSNGTVTGANSRMAMENETGATVTKLRAYFVNWKVTATNEADNTNPITLTAAVEYPAGTFTPFLYGGSLSTVLGTSSALGETDELTLPIPIPADARYWIKTFVSVSSGQKWCTGFIVNTTRGEAVSASAGETDKTQVAFTNAGGVRMYGPVGVVATGFTGTPKKISAVGIGDSMLYGATDVEDSISRGAVGWLGKAAAGRMPYMNFGVTGTKASDNLPVNFPRRLALIKKLRVNTIILNWSNNDVIAGNSFATIQSNILAIANDLIAQIPGVRVVWCTGSPRTSSTDAFVTVANQTIITSPNGGHNPAGSTSVRAQVDDWIRTKPAPFYDIMEVADCCMTGRNSGIWKAGGDASYAGEYGVHITAANPKFTTDGLHASALGTSSPYYGGTYSLRDEVGIPKIDGWLAAA